MAVEGGTRVIKYLLFIFNLLFLLAGLALIIVGAVAAAKLAPYSTATIGVRFNGVGVFLIIIGGIIFLISFFGCLGAYKENYCLLITFVVLMVLMLIALIAALIAAFVMKNQMRNFLETRLNETISVYNDSNAKDINKLWDLMQPELECCGANEPEDWKNNLNVNPKNVSYSSVPDSCCKSFKANCGKGALSNSTKVYYLKGCASVLSDDLNKNIVAVGGAAAAIAILQFIGIVFACCLVHGIRKEYNMVK